MKDKLILIIVALTLATSVFIAMRGKHTADNEHQDFFVEVRQFMNKGDRNTAQDGLRRDVQIRALQQQIRELQSAK